MRYTHLEKRSTFKFIGHLALQIWGRISFCGGGAATKTIFFQFYEARSRLKLNVRNF